MAYGDGGEFNLGSMFDFGGGDASPYMPMNLAGADASSFPGEEELYPARQQPYWSTQGRGSGAEFFDRGQGQNTLGIANTTPEMLAAMGFTGSGSVNTGAGDNFEQIVNPDLYPFMARNGQTYGTHYNGESEDSMTNQIFDKSGSPIKGATSTWKMGNDDAFLAAMILAGGVMGGAAAGVGAAGAGSGGAATAAGTGTNAALIESGLGTTGYGASSAGLGGGAASTATNAALIDSALQTPGYGASSAGFGGGAGQTGFSLANLGQRAGKGALWNGGMTAARGGSMNDILKSAGYGAVGGGLSYGIDSYNPGASVTDNPDWQRVVNRGVTSGAGALASGGNPLTSAVMGAGFEGGNVIGGNLWNGAVNSPSNDGGGGDMPDFSLGGESNSPVKDWFANNNQQSAAPVGFTNSDEVNASLGNNTSSSMFNPDFVSTGSAPSTQSSNPFKSLISQAMTQQAGGGGGSPKFGDMAGSLMGLYSAYQNKKKLGQLRGGLESMFGADSPYAQTLGKQLARRDAAAGRRSQYGPREVELQARLAEMNSRNAPTIQNLINGENQARNSGLWSLGRLGQQTGATPALGNWLQQMFQQYGNGGWGSGNSFGNQDLGGYL